MKEIFFIALVLLAVLVSMGVVGNEEFLHSEYIKEDKSKLITAGYTHG